jgi:intracellular sulfur oxidation DsrE/DsrF family protein
MSHTVLPSSTPRRGFLGGIVAGAGALLVGRWSTANAELASLGETSVAGDEWVARIKGKYKQVFDCPNMSGNFGAAYPLNFINSTKEATKTTDADITPVLVFRHFAMPVTLNDATWAKYKLGEVLDVKDPKTNAPAVRNIYRANIPLYEGVTYEDLTKRGVVIVACNLALTVISGMAASKAGVSADQAKKDFTAGLLSGVFLAASGVYAVNRAQQAGCSYCYAG